MINKKMCALLGSLVVLAGYSIATNFTDLDTTQHEGKTGLKDLITGIDANFAMIEAGTATMIVSNNAINVCTLKACTITNATAINACNINLGTITSSTITNGLINTPTIKAATIQNGSVITGCTITNSAINEPSSVTVDGAVGYTGTNTYIKGDSSTGTCVVIKGIVKSM